MDIGGEDLTVDIVPQQHHLYFLVMALEIIWPQGIVQFDDDDKVHAGTRVTLKWLTTGGRTTMAMVNPPSSFFVYQSQASYEAWDKLGRTDEFAESMIWIQADDKGIHFTYDSKVGASGRIVEDLAAGIIATRSH